MDCKEFDIKTVSFELAKQFVRDDTLILKPEYDYIMLYHKGAPVSLLGVDIMKSGVVKLHSNYTPVEYRGNGFFSLLLVYVKRMHCGKKLMADCTDFSKGIYAKAGFHKVFEKQFKRFTITRMELCDYGKTEERD